MPPQHRSEAAGAVDPVRFPVVAMVASAGGLDVLISILKMLPAELPAAVLIGLHQQPDRQSELTRLLSRDSALPVRVAEDDATLVAGRVLVIPPGRHLLVASNDRIALIDSGQAPPSRPSADLMLATLAVTCGSRAVAVVLSGYGHDGQAGVRAVVRYGGTVLVQDRPTSAQFGMPGAAIGTELIEAVNILPPEGIARAIAERAGIRRSPDRI